MHALDASYEEEEEEEEEERPPRSVVRQTGLTRTQKMRITPLKLFFGTIQISCHYPLIVTATLTQRNRTIIFHFWGYPLPYGKQCEHHI